MSRSALFKRILLATVAVVLALDAASVVKYFNQGQCSLKDSMAAFTRSFDVDRTAKNLMPRLRLQKTEDGLDQWATPRGDVWTVHGDTILPFLIAEQEADIYEPAGHEVRPGDIVIDCGANIGVFTRKALDRGAKLVVAIEPAPRTVAAFRKNFDQEIRSGRVIIYPKGAWDSEGELSLKVDPDNQAANSLVLGSGNAPTVQVPLTTIDHMVAELNLPRVDFIKMDIEGAEKHALNGARETIRRFRPRMSISSEHLGDDFTAIPATVQSLEPGYTHHGCYCQIRQGQLHSLVLAFDPVGKTKD